MSNFTIPITKHPFALYDFIGYLVPGIYLLCTFVYLEYFCLMEKCNEHHNLLHALRLSDFISNNKDTEYIILVGVFFVIFLYILGQIISVLSNIIIDELPFVLATRKPFGVILGKEDFERKRWCILEILYLKNKYYFINDENSFRYVLNDIFDFFKVLCNVIFWLIPLLLPLSLFVLLFSPQLDKKDVESKLPILHNFFRVQPFGLPEIAYDKIKSIIDENFGKCDSSSDINTYFHYIYHYVIEYSDVHYSKIQNYVALYGFMRNMLMGNMLLFYYSFYLTFYIGMNICLILIFSFLNVIFLYGYLKYTRRFTEEIIFAACAIKDKDDDKNDINPSSPLS